MCFSMDGRLVVLVATSTGLEACKPGSAVVKYSDGTYGVETGDYLEARYHHYPIKDGLLKIGGKKDSFTIKKK